MGVRAWHGPRQVCREEVPPLRLLRSMQRWLLYVCVWQMVNAGYANGREQARRTGYSGMDFARQAHSRGVETEALEFYLQLGIKAKVQDLSDYGDGCDDW